MAISAVPKNFRDGTILIEDATGTPIALTVQYEPGDMQIPGLNQGTKAYEVSKLLDRGDFYAARKTNQSFPAISFTAHATDFSDATEKTIPDCIRKLGAFASGVSTLGANADVWGLKITLTIEGTQYGDNADHTVVMNGVICTVDIAEGDPNTFTVNGEVTGTITMT